MTLPEFRNLIRGTLGIQESNSEISYRVLEKETKRGYNQLLITYVGYEGDSVNAFLLLPSGQGPFPGVLVHHQHNSQWHLGKSEVCGIEGDPFNAFGQELARNGIVVLAPDAVGFEDRRANQKGTEQDEQSDWLQYYNGMAYRLVEGRLLMSTLLNDALIATSLLSSIPQVNTESVGTVGHSFGGITAIFQAAIDERIRFICASGAAASYKIKMAAGTGLEMSLVVPSILEKMDIPDIVKCISPRHVLLVSATDDPYSNDAAAITESVHDELKRLNEVDNLEHKSFNGGHALTAERFDYITKWMIAHLSKQPVG